MESKPGVAAPPPKPLLLFDGGCGFCGRWVRRWQRATTGKVDYVPFQDETLAARFPELELGKPPDAVVFIETDGGVYRGAEAVFRTLAYTRHEGWLRDCYEDFPIFARVSDWTYGKVAAHRGIFSWVTRLFWGSHSGPSSEQLVRWVFLRSLGMIYLIAFASLWVQLPGLFGANGIRPVSIEMEALRQQAAAAHVGWERFHIVPTLCWFGGGDTFLKVQCWAGMLLAALVVFNLAPAFCLFLLWLIYLSLVTVGGEFLSFQWDCLLLETGLLAVFFAPLQLRPGVARAPPPSRLVVWLLRWLLFRLMFASGCVKLLSGDPVWHNLTALNFHYETQPLPTWIGWYASQLPAAWHKAETATMFGIELVLPFLVFAPRRLRLVPFVGFGFLQMGIWLTGNYCFFNLLSMALGLLLLDDAVLGRLVPARLGFLKRKAESAPEGCSRRREEAASSVPPVVPESASSGRRLQLGWPLLVLVPFACVTALISALHFGAMFRVRVPWPYPVLAVYNWVGPLRSWNSYGLFAVMTTNRVEIIVEGSNDGVTWLPYEFKYKPGELQRRPGFVEPHQPRLDWQMWFAALGDYRQNPWFVNFCVRLLQGSPEVLGLMKRNPFPNAPPRYIRATAYEYHFTDLATGRRTGEWWRREKKGSYLPVISLRDATP